ncbi:MAG: class I SAM-dependent methyltransferase [Thermodesulfobacteriota bacterium]|nr:class I SAM-dependent methyltransferase [Thermodesulfobacteriota bacterium]
MKRKEALHIIGGRESHDVLRKNLASRKPGKILDAPCGTGILSKFLKERGFLVYCCDIDKNNFKFSDVPFKEANLNRKLPYEDCMFDYVLCANGVHRLFNVYGVLKEFNRVLKPEGILFITVNNYASIVKRLRFFFYGSITNTINESTYYQEIDSPEANFRQPLFYPQLANSLKKAGFAIIDIKKSSVKFSHSVLVPFAWLIKFGTFFVSKRSFNINMIEKTRSSALLPGGKYFFVEARKID